MVQNVFSKKITSVFLTLMLVVFGTIVLKMSVFATEETKIADECVSVEPVQLEISDYRTEKVTINGVEYYTKTPEKPDMIFAGWFQDVECKKPISGTISSGTYWAKFVPKHILTVKGQVSKETYTKGDAECRDLRVVTTVDSLWYSKVGFQMEIGTSSKHIFSNTVYTQIHAVGDQEGEYINYTPSGEFCALSSYFKTWTFTGIPKDSWDTVICATPFWVTMDGTIVYGERGEKSVNQGLSENPDLKPYVAQIGDNFYETLEDAVKAVTSSDTTKITLLKDIKIDSTIILSNKNIVLTNKDETSVMITRETNHPGYLFEVTSGSLTIEGVKVNGQSGIVMDGNNAGRNQLLRAAGDITIKNMTIQNATGSAGAAIRMDSGALTIDSCLIKGSRGSNSTGGGAIFLDKTATSNISNATFEDNSAVNGNGGAIYVRGTGTHRITNCNFTGNQAAKNGGAIYADENSKVSILADEMGTYAFTNNTATGTSCATNYVWGAIANNSSQTLIYSSNYTYTDNTDGGAEITGDGVGAHATGNERTLIKVDVEVSNYSELQDAINNATTKTATQITLLNDMESSSQTALSAGQHVILTNKAGEPVTITRGTTHKARLFAVRSGSLTIEGAEADGKSGIVIDANKVVGTNQLLYANGGDFTIKNTTIQDAHSASVGAVIRIDSGTLTIDNCLIKGSQGKGTGGGAIFLDKTATSNISNTTFNNNTTTGSGGAIYVRGTGTHTITNCNFTGNQATQNGGAIFAAEDSTVSVLVDGTGTYGFANNTATGNGCTAGYVWGAIANASSVPLQYSTAYTYTGNTNGTTETTGEGVGPVSASSSVTSVNISTEEQEEV